MFDRVPGDRLWTTPETVNVVGAWVTNGLETGRYTAEDFTRLSAWEG
ncbi:hypothetical protein JYK02_14665 [Corallococcus macrosporus]|uniref:Uncharacterized protein n=1 Tax=Corallococcus macrosporus TaxID=35 RepID=A0ABS3DAT3_9BACT|nr:hypothetical protein [Corallococcus macrosporus]MBN8228748.1 hypothetical protein [Corallococcus macrosporus]